MRRAIPILIVLFLATPSPAQPPAQQAASPKISINVDRQPLVQGQPFSLTIHIETSSKGDPEVRLPRFGSMRILSQSESHPMSFHFSFGFGSGRSSRTKRESNYTFVLVGDKPGRYKLDPVVVTLDGQKYQGQSYTLNLLPSGAPPSKAGPSRPSQPQQAKPLAPTDPFQGDPRSASMPKLDSTELDGAKIDPDFFIQTHVSKNKAVVGEPLVLTIYLYTARNISDLNVVREPGTEGFWVENLLPANRQLTTEPVQISGRGYDRAVLRKTILFPIKPGVLTIAPTMVDLEVRRGGFFSRRKSIKRASLPVQIDVSQLPTENQPPGFNPANVGTYNFKAKADQTEVKVGEPVTLTLKVRGDGNLRNLVMPELTEVTGFKTYAPESEVNVRTQGESITGTRSNRVLMIPKEPGEYVVPKISWSYYDPRRGKYKTVSSRPQKVVVHPSQSSTPGSVAQAQGQAPAQSAVGQDRLNRQLRSILSRADLEAGSGTHIVTRPWFLGLAIGVPLLYLGVILISRTRRKLAEGQVKGRSKRADTRALRRLAQLSKNANESTNFFAELERILIDFLEDRLEVPIAGDTMADLRTRLGARGFTPDHAEKVATEMESCDFARFARSAGKQEEKHQALKRMEQLIRELANVRVSPPPKDRR
ncbi:MAG: protein BatD [Proteobacteria bacterium]|nr:protein BatD [Pseudomonadota bacterium]